MKQILFIYSTFVLLLGLSACTKDGLSTDGAEGTPMTFTATGLDYPDVRSRVTVDGTWTNVTDVAVQVEGMVKKYNVDLSGEDHFSATLRSDNPFYWQNTDAIEVEAWWPYDESNMSEMPKVIVKADQGNIDDFIGSDYIHAHSASVEFDNPSLEFSHRTVRMTVTLTAGNGFTDISGATVSLNGLSTADGNPATITPYQAGEASPFDALLAPQTIPEKTKLISVNLNGITYHYTTKSALTLGAGQWYKYTVRINKTGLELIGNTVGGWNDENAEIEAGMSGYTVTEDGTYLVNSAAGLYAWAKQVLTTGVGSCKLLKDITLPAPTEGESNWTPLILRSGTFDGNGHSVSGMAIKGSNNDHIVEGFIEKGEGFFVYIENRTTVKNLGLKDVNITGRGHYIGGITGINRGTIVACYVSGAIDLEHGNETGGVVGSNDGILTGCYFTGSVKGESEVGGVIGISYGTTNACYWSGTVTKNSGTGNGGDENLGTEVDGTNVTWKVATQAMNEALKAENSEWVYIQSNGSDNPPVLQKNK